nr:MAG TPA: hypothetical protein [Caudoviricetes sp.]
MKSFSLCFFYVHIKNNVHILLSFECKASRQIFNVFSPAMNQSINKAYNMHAIATDGVGYTIPPFARSIQGGLTPYPLKNF